MTYCFRTPVDFGLGGFSMWDGEIKTQVAESMHADENSTLLDFCVNATAGNHLLELYGAEDCCDATTKWSF